jgi:hypothetical protein
MEQLDADALAEDTAHDESVREECSFCREPAPAGGLSKCVDCPRLHCCGEFAAPDCDSEGFRCPRCMLEVDATADIRSHLDGEVDA